MVMLSTQRLGFQQVKLTGFLDCIACTFSLDFLLKYVNSAMLLFSCLKIKMFVFVGN